MREITLVARVGVADGMTEGVEELGIDRDVLVGLAQDPEERDEDRELDEEWQATRQGIDLVLLVELHHLLVLLLLVVLVLRLDLLDLGLGSLHRHHRFGLLGRQREQHEHHQDGEQDDGDPEVGDQPVEESQDRTEEVEDRVHGGSALLCRERGVGRTRVRHGNVVDTARVPRVAASHPLHGEPRASSRAVDPQRIQRVLRARRVETAAGRQVPAHQLPATNGCHERPATNDGRGVDSTEVMVTRSLPRSRELGHRAHQAVEGQGHRGPPRREQVDPPGREVLLPSRDCSTEPSADPVAVDGGADPPADGETDARR